MVSENVLHPELAELINNCIGHVQIRVASFKKTIESRLLDFKLYPEEQKQIITEEIKRLPPRSFVMGQELLQILDSPDGIYKKLCEMGVDKIPFVIKRKGFIDLENSRIGMLRTELIDAMEAYKKKEYLKSKMNQMANADAAPKSRKGKYPSRLGRPELVLLAKLLSESDFKSEDTSQKEIAESLSILSGHSQNTIAQDFSKHNNGNLDLKPYKSKVKQALQKMIDKLDSM